MNVTIIQCQFHLFERYFKKYTNVCNIYSIILTLFINLFIPSSGSLILHLYMVQRSYFESDILVDQKGLLYSLLSIYGKA